MFNLMSLLFAVALVSQLCLVEVTARQIGNKKIDLNYALRAKTHTDFSRLKIDSFLKIFAPAETVEHQAGTTTVLECRATGLPAPTVIWMKNGELLPESEQQAAEIINFERTSIVNLISRLVVTAPSNGDVYTCTATSLNGQVSASITVLADEGEDASNVLDQLYELPMEPIITTYYRHVLQDFETAVTLPCRVRSLTDSQVYWFDNHNKPVYGNPHFKVLPSGDLYIAKLGWSDMGDYTCTVKNMYGKDSAVTFLYPLKQEDTVQ